MTYVPQSSLGVVPEGQHSSPRLNVPSTPVRLNIGETPVWSLKHVEVPAGQLPPFTTCRLHPPFAGRVRGTGPSSNDLARTPAREKYRVEIFWRIVTIDRD